MTVSQTSASRLTKRESRIGKVRNFDARAYTVARDIMLTRRLLFSALSSE